MNLNLNLKLNLKLNHNTVKINPLRLLYYTYVPPFGGLLVGRTASGRAQRLHPVVVLVVFAEGTVVRPHPAPGLT